MQECLHLSRQLQSHTWMALVTVVGMHLNVIHTKGSEGAWAGGAGRREVIFALCPRVARETVTSVAINLRKQNTRILLNQLKWCVKCE